MYLIYIDESGQANWVNSTDYYTLAAAIVLDSKWQQITLEIDHLKNQIFPRKDPSTWELHATDIKSGRGLFKGMAPQDRFDILKLSYEEIGKMDIRAIGVTLRKAKYVKRVDLEEWAFRFMMERVSLFLDQNNQHSFITDFGLVLIDAIQPKFDNKRRREIRDFMKYGSLYVNNNYLIEDPVFVKSHFRNMAQVADMLAYLFKRLEFTNHGKKFQQYYRSVRKIMHNRNGTIPGYGLKRYP